MWIEGEREQRVSTGKKRERGSRAKRRGNCCKRKERRRMQGRVEDLTE